MPQACSVVPGWHCPFCAQHPLGQVAAEQVGWHCPFWQVPSTRDSSRTLAPPVPQACSVFPGWQLPVLVTTPVGTGRRGAGRLPLALAALPRSRSARWHSCRRCPARGHTLAGRNSHPDRTPARHSWGHNTTPALLHWLAGDWQQPSTGSSRLAAGVAGRGAAALAAGADRRGTDEVEAVLRATLARFGAGLVIRGTGSGIAAPTRHRPAQPGSRRSPGRSRGRCASRPA